MDNPAADAIMETVESVAQHKLPRWSELPDLDIYMDQVISLMTRYFEGYPGNDEKGLTPSMVNNYVKLGIMPAPNRKKYNREHLAYLIIICVLKTVMPIGQIGQLISAKLRGEASYESLYNRFCDYYESSVSTTAQTTERRMESDYDCTDIIFSSALRAHAEQTLALGLMKRFSALEG